MTEIAGKPRRLVYKGWDAWQLQSGQLELLLVPQVGGRIMGVRWRGAELFFVQPERQGQVEDLSGVLDVQAKKREMGFPLWGGDKTWLAPQERWLGQVPFLDLDSGQYDFQVESVESLESDASQGIVVCMTSPICRETGVQITRTVRLSHTAPGWTVIHHLHNASPSAVQWGIWGVSMLVTPGQIYLPKNPQSRHPGGVKTFETEGRSTEVRPSVVSELGGLAVIQCGGPAAFKFGVDAAEGWVLGIFEVAQLGLVGYRKAVPVYEGQAYGHDCVTEVFNSDRYPYCELEMHGPLVCLQPGESFSLEEKHTLFDVSGWPHSEGEVRQLNEGRIDHG